MIKVLLVVLFAGIVSAALAPPAPVWPKQYEITGKFLIPYFNISEPLYTAYDSLNSRQYIEYYNGLNKKYLNFNAGLDYVVSPVYNTSVCAATNTSGAYVMLLPDLSANWNYGGIKTLKVNGQDVSVNVWTNTSKQFDFTNQYAFYTSTADGSPVRLDMYGYDFIWDSHPDKYILEYTKFSPGIANKNVFNLPALCDNPVIIGGGNGPTADDASRLDTHLARLNHEGHPIFEKFHNFVQKFKKTYSSSTEYFDRMSVFKTFHEYIESHNSQDRPYKLAMNHFGDMTEEEFKSHIIPHVARPKNNGATAIHPVPSRIQLDNLPTYVNWTSIGAVTAVKDQGVCGSCWTFGSTGSLEGVWYLKHKQLVSLSEQQLVDCAWYFNLNGPNLGCQGGFASGAYQWIINNNGIATEKHYPYLMQNDYCKAQDHSSGVSITGYVNVTSFSEPALQDAVANVGPIAIAIDASHPSFRFYTSGVYYEPQCQSGLDNLDHEVLAAGYGTTTDGQDYWLVKNSWSTYWGNLGYIQMSRNRDNNCGVASCATYPIAA